MKFPVIIRHRREKATIYGKSPGYDFFFSALGWAL
jgi:hypothetical protein